VKYEEELDHFVEYLIVTHFKSISVCRLLPSHSLFLFVSCRFPSKRRKKKLRIDHPKTFFQEMEELLRKIPLEEVPFQNSHSPSMFAKMIAKYSASSVISSSFPSFLDLRSIQIGFDCGYSFTDVWSW